ncbi:MAG: glycosyltransferase family 2 protein [Alistipes sp.]|nr:glycosyltransferase family 2 protein [Alistipes sp.]
MKISVIIPSYKPQAYIWECLDSIKNQTFSKEDFEIILVLNGCKEPYYSQIRNYIEQNLSGYSVNFIQTDQGGVSNARNIALDVARGEYVTFIDDDDYISPKYLEELYQAASPDTVSLCYPYAFNDGDADNQLEFYVTNAYKKCHLKTKHRLSSKVRKYFSGPCMKLIPMSFIQDRRFDVRFKNGEDSLFMFLISDKIDKISFTTEDAVYYRRFRKGSAISLHSDKKQIAKVIIRLIRAYSMTYFKAINRYNFCFYATRILGAVKVLFIR